MIRSRTCRVRTCRPDREGVLIEGAVIGGYRIGARLGSGSTGVVYAAYAPNGDPVAVKLLRSELAADPQLLARFAAEARLVAQLASRHVVRVLEVVHDPPIVAMERIDGRSLGATVEESGPLAPRAVVVLARALLEALVEAHGIGLLHRDLKPDNVFLCPDGPKLLDFGLAALADRGGLVGTIAFMSPEQARGEASTELSDVYGVGATLYFAASGRRPFTAPNEAALLTRVEAGGAEPLPEQVPAALSEVILRAMSRAPEDRFPSAAAMAEALPALS